MLLLVDCCDWLVIFGCACVKICWGWANWDSRHRYVGSWGRNLKAREPPWKQNGLPPMVNIMQIVLAKSQSTTGASHQPDFMGSCLTISHMCLACLSSR